MKDRCCYCMKARAITRIIFVDEETDNCLPVCFACLEDHLFREGGCEDEECGICPGDMTLEEGLELAESLGIEVEYD